MHFNVRLQFWNFSSNNPKTLDDSSLDFLKYNPKNVRVFFRSSYLGIVEWTVEKKYCLFCITIVKSRSEEMILELFGYKSSW
jgi:hypothetical protein